VKNFKCLQHCEDVLTEQFGRMTSTFILYDLTRSVRPNTTEWRQRLWWHVSADTTQL